MVAMVYTSTWRISVVFLQSGGDASKHDGNASRIAIARGLRMHGTANRANVIDIQEVLVETRHKGEVEDPVVLATTEIPMLTQVLYGAGV